MIESDAYIRAGSPFDRHFVPETSDPATYVGCHYVDQFGWFTGLRPTQVVVSGVLGQFESGTPCYSWAATQLTYESCVLQLINGLQHAGDHRGRNHQGLEIWGYNPNDLRGTYFCHHDNLRGMDYVFCRDHNPGRPTDAGSDYVGFLPRSDGSPGQEMVGYGWRAIEAMVKTAIRVQAGVTWRLAADCWPRSTRPTSSPPPRTQPTSGLSTRRCEARSANRACPWSSTTTGASPVPDTRLTRSSDTSCHSICFVPESSPWVASFP